MREPLLPLAALTIAATLVLTLASCGEIGNASKEAGDIGFGREMNEWTDPSTGCIYYIYRSGWGNTAIGGMTAKLRRDGTPNCPGVEGDDRQMQLQETPFP